MRTVLEAQPGTTIQTGHVLPAISTIPNQAPPDMPLPAPITAENSAFKKPEFSEKWGWSQSKIHKVQYNKGIQEWVENDPDFANWVRTCIMVHADNGADESRCSIPDRWAGEVGKFITIVTSDCLPGPRTENSIRTHTPKAGVYHVMA